MSEWLPEFIEDQEELKNSILPLVGITLMVVSGFTPWFQSRMGDMDWKFSPMSIDALWPASTLMILLIVACSFKLRDSITASGLYSLTLTVWGTFAAWVWIFGSQINHLLPFHHVPHGLIPGPRFGVYLGILTGLIGLISGVFPRFGNQLSTKKLFEFLVSLVLAVLLIWSRDAPWIVLSANNFQYRVSSDVIPVLGQLFALLCLLTFLVLVIVNFSSHILMKVSLLGMSLAVFGYGLVAWILNHELARMVKYVARSISISEGNVEIQNIGSGPKLLALSGALSAAFSIYLLFDRHRDDVSTIIQDGVPTSSIDTTGIKFVD